ncbi:MAG: SUMF1/EgtB/PvdO family nonheme iron enzyme [Lachnospiraceae bacterium]|nr:SUMF1/EgtB/PvdO family nonheme iron enzyme [Lachnospiraceae bacterium]
MKQKALIKRIIDAAMLLLLPVLMAEILTGQQAHEWLGTGMVLLFILHHILNFGWMRNLFQGTYSPLRCAGTALNILLLFDFLTLAFSGIMMSGFVFDWLPFSGGMLTARTLHLFASYWGLILMSLHTGMHWKLILDMCKKKLPEIKSEDVFLWLLRGAAFGIVLFGIYAASQQKIMDYLFMRTHFVFFDETKSVFLFYMEVVSMIGMFIVAGHYFGMILQKWRCGTMGKKIAKILAFCIPVVVIAASIFSLNRGSSKPEDTWGGSSPSQEENTGSENLLSQEEAAPPQTENTAVRTDIEDGFILILGGTFEMGSPDGEAWRSDDETLHTVTVSDFYISPYELTQKEYQAICGENPSNFVGDDLPVENISWLDAARYCNARSEREGLASVYVIDGENVSWNRAADGYRLPTEAEWEYACRAGTATPFNTETSIGADEANYYGHYPYMIEDNYFSQENLDTKPGEYRQTTVAVDSFSPNGYGLYNMHGNVSEWVWDTYGSYGADGETNPTGAESGNRKVCRGGGWNDFAKNMRSAYRATLEPDAASFNLGMRLVRGAVSGENGVIQSSQTDKRTEGDGKILIAYFSWGGNTRGVAEEIQAQTGADLFEITCVEPYSNDYNTVLEEAQHDQNIQARPLLADHVENMDAYDIVMIGYPNWWASIPMPIASFLEEYDFSGKLILPFCSHGGGRFGQSLTAIAKLAPDAELGEGLSVHYSGGSELPGDVEEWLKANRIIE